jgi:hypothetical protein
MWGIQLACAWNSSKQGSIIRVATYAESIPVGSICRCAHLVEFVDQPDLSGRYAGPHLFGEPVRDSWGCADFLGLGFMPGGFDEAAWAAKGLPGSHIELRLTVKDVGTACEHGIVPRAVDWSGSLSISADSCLLCWRPPCHWECAW